MGTQKLLLLPHVTDGHLGDANVCGLGYGEEDGGSGVVGVHHGGLLNALFGATVADGELRLDAAGAKDGDLDAEGVELFSEGLAEAHLGELAGAVDAFVGNAGEACDGGDEDDIAGALLQEGGENSLREDKAAADVAVHHGVEVLQGGVCEGFVVADAGVVDQDVDASVGLERGVAGEFCGGRVGCVAGDGDGVLEVLRELLQGFCAARDEDGLSAGGGEECGGGSAEAGAGAGDDGDLALEWGSGMWCVGHALLEHSTWCER